MSGFTFLTTFSGILSVPNSALAQAELGTYFGAVGVFIVITQIFILGPLTKRFSERRF
jgi:hypothetical protein